MEKILVTGATGNYGKATIDALLKKSVNANLITALVRNEAKAAPLKDLRVNIAIANYNDYGSLIKAFAGIDKLLLVSSSELENRTEQQLNAVKAAKEAGVSHILYTSVERKTDHKKSPINFVLSSHLATENAIKESGLNYTFLRNGLYMDTLPWFLGEKVLENGIFLPAGGGKIAFALRNEMAEAVAHILTTEGHINKEYDISGEAISFSEIAALLSEISGKKVPYTSPDLETFIATTTAAGVPEMFATMFGGFSEAARQGELEGGHSELEKLIGRKPTNTKTFLTQIYK